MTAAYRLRGVGWFGGCVAIVLSFYLVSLQVAAERGRLEGVNAKIEAAERDIRALETEFDTRANLAQLEKWNGDTLSLSAPTAGQYVADETALASLDVTGGAMGGGVQTAALVVPAAPAAVTAQPTTTSAPLQAAMVKVAAATPVTQSAVIRVSAERTATAVTAKLEAAARGAVAVARVRPQAVAMLDRKLLSDNTLGDILSGARAEARRLR